MLSSPICKKYLKPLEGRAPYRTGMALSASIPNGSWVCYAMSYRLSPHGNHMIMFDM
jgi:hypothetical protein